MKGKKGHIYRICLSNNMLTQKGTDWAKYNLNEFLTFDDAYNFCIQKWGSGSLNSPLGWGIERKKIGAMEWKFVTSA